MPVTIGEELLLLALDDTEGVQRGDTTKVGYAVVGAHLLELALLGRIDMEGKKIVTRDSRPIGEPATDQVLSAIASDKRIRKPGDWLWTLATKSVEATARSLVHKGLVREQDKRVLGLFKTKRYPAVNAAPESAALERMRRVIVDGQQPEPRTMSLISMVHAAGLAKELFPDADRKAVVARVEEIAKQAGDMAESAAAAVSATSAAVQAAVTTAVLSGAIATTSAST